MNEQQIRALVQQEVQRQNQAGTFNVQNIPFHTHNGVDSPLIYSPTITYTGYVPANGDISGVTTDGFVFFPQGWSVSTTFLSGSYVIFHNLGTPYYTVQAIMAGNGIPLDTVPIVGIQEDDFVEIYFMDNTGTSREAPFQFLITVVNNANQSVPLYTTQGT